jgi:uncharacterized membrane protein
MEERMRKPRTVDELTERNLELVTRIEHTAKLERTLGDRVADGVAATVGSWPFIIIQSVLLVGWLVLNLVAWVRHWDPYPFILLNLALSFQAAYASPIIMMSQNRAARLADHRNQLDLQINMLSEQENTETLRMLQLLCHHAGINLEDKQVNILEQATHPDRMLRQIEELEQKEHERHRKDPHER